MRPRWSVVIPMWREATRIERTIAALAQSGLAASDIELIFVDDGSDDRTAETCEAALATHDLVGKVARLPRNQGKGAAVRRGCALATGDVVGFADADLSCGPADIERVFSEVASGRCDVAIASRTQADTMIAVHQPRLRRWSGAAFNLHLRALGLTRFKDTQCGLKALRADLVPQLITPLVTDRYAFDVELLARATRAGLAVTEVPVAWEHVEASRVRPLRDGGRMVADALRIRRALRA
jgi:dolichyl-phosphate beta-glucosyltransferase